jgi:hypothetical protein
MLFRKKYVTINTLLACKLSILKKDFQIKLAYLNILQEFDLVPSIPLEYILMLSLLCFSDII